MPKATSYEVAERAGVSQSTVSRALSGFSRVSEETRERVRAAAQELGYFVDERAARLRRGETGTLAIVVIGKREDGANRINPFYYSLLGSICSAASNRGYETLVSFQSDPDRLYGHYVERGQAEGVIVLGSTSNTAAWNHFHALARINRRMIFWGSPHDDADWIRSDNQHGARLAVQRLIAGGHRAILFMGDPQSPQRQFRERYEGYGAAMRDLGLTPRIIETRPLASREEEGREAIVRLIEQGTAFDGLFIACDAMALGALAALKERGLSVPGQIGVIGFDGIGSGQHCDPPLTTIEPDMERAGAMLVDGLLAAAPPGTRDRVPVRLAERASVAQPRG